MVYEMTGISFSLMNYIFEYHTQPYITYYIKEQTIFSMWLMKKQVGLGLFWNCFLFYQVSYRVHIFPAGLPSAGWGTVSESQRQINPRAQVLRGVKS